LEKAARLVAPMGKITMKAAGNPKFADKEHEGTERHGFQINSSPKHGETRQMKHDKKAAGETNIKAARHIDFVQFGGSGQITQRTTSGRMILLKFTTDSSLT
jgi:hypothetical protein